MLEPPEPPAGHTPGTSHGVDGAGWDGSTPGSGAGSAGEAAADADADVTTEERFYPDTWWKKCYGHYCFGAEANSDGKLTWDAYNTV